MHNIFYCCERYCVLLYTSHYIILYTNAFASSWWSQRKFSSASAFEAALTHREKASWSEKAKEDRWEYVGPPAPKIFSF